MPCGCETAMVPPGRGKLRAQLLSIRNGAEEQLTAQGLWPVVQTDCMKSALWDAVIFDYGNVLSSGPTAEDLLQFTAITGVPDLSMFFELYAETRAAYDSGEQDYRQHWQTFCNAAKVALTSEQVDRLAALETRMWMRVSPEMLALARKIKASGTRIAILSNMPVDLLAELRRGLPWLDEFDVQTWSCDLGIVKPAAAIYRACLDALRCQPDRALFFDDRSRNVDAARALGIDAHLFESAEQARRVVQQGLVLRAGEFQIR